MYNMRHTPNEADQYFALLESAVQSGKDHDQAMWKVARFICNHQLSWWGEKHYNIVEDIYGGLHKQISITNGSARVANDANRMYRNIIVITLRMVISDCLGTFQRQQQPADDHYWCKELCKFSDCETVMTQINKSNQLKNEVVRFNIDRLAYSLCLYCKVKNAYTAKVEKEYINDQDIMVFEGKHFSAFVHHQWSRCTSEDCFSIFDCYDKSLFEAITNAHPDNGATSSGDVVQKTVTDNHSSSSSATAEPKEISDDDNTITSYTVTTTDNFPVDAGNATGLSSNESILPSQADEDIFDDDEEHDFDTDEDEIDQSSNENREGRHCTADSGNHSSSSSAEAAEDMFDDDKEHDFDTDEDEIDQSSNENEDGGQKSACGDDAAVATETMLEDLAKIHDKRRYRWSGSSNCSKKKTRVLKAHCSFPSLINPMSNATYQFESILTSRLQRRSLLSRYHKSTKWQKAKSVRKLYTVVNVGQGLLGTLEKELQSLKSITALRQLENRFIPNDFDRNTLGGSNGRSMYPLNNPDWLKVNYPGLFQTLGTISTCMKHFGKEMKGCALLISKPNCGNQLFHTDYKPFQNSNDYSWSHPHMSFSGLLALQNDTKIDVRFLGEETTVVLKMGDLILMCGNLEHRGCDYAVENCRVFFYCESDRWRAPYDEVYVTHVA